MFIQIEVDHGLLIFQMPILVDSEVVDYRI
jgi:hypothetical protein